MNTHSAFLRKHSLKSFSRKCGKNLKFHDLQFKRKNFKKHDFIFIFNLIATMNDLFAFCLQTNNYLINVLKPVVV